MSRRVVPAAAFLVTALLPPACAPSDAAPRWTVRDSAGIEIVTNATDAPRWQLSDEPVLELGSIDEPGPTQFFRVADVELLDDGGLVVANAGSDELRIFDAGGAHVASVGRNGHGPGEFDGVSMVESFADSLLVYDTGNQRLSMRRLDGSLVRTFQLFYYDGILFPVDLQGAAGYTGDRGILAVTARYMSQLKGEGVVVDTALVSLYDMDGILIDSLVRLPHNQRVVRRAGDFQTTLGYPYGGGASIVGDARGFCSALGPAETWLVLDDGGWVGRLPSPLGFRVLDVRGDRIAGVWQDDVGIEYVRVYRYVER